MNGVYLIVITFFIVAVFLVAVVLHFIQKKKIKKIQEELAELDKEKNMIMSTPVPLELSKVEAVIKNEKMEGKYKQWQQRFQLIKDERLAMIDDMLIEVDSFAETRDYKTVYLKLAKTELEICKVKEAAEELLGEIREITLSEEKYRDIVTKLKARYRELVQAFERHKGDYEDIGDVIELQFENIEKRFADFEVVMENNEYNEVVHIVKALDTMIDHISIVIEEVPNLVFFAEKLIPKRIEEVETTYREMVEKGYGLGYLKIEYNMEELKKNTNNILDRVRVLNLEECMFELKTMLDYIDSLFNDFEKERICRKNYEETVDTFAKKLKKINKIVRDIYQQLDDIKNMYDLKDEDLLAITEVKQRLECMNHDYEQLLASAGKHEEPYSTLSKTVEKLSVELKVLEDDLDLSLKNLGSMYDDEMRAREQLIEIQDLLDQCKLEMRSYKLPIITNNYFVQLAEANEAIVEIVKELEKKPIVIKVLNTRVDTARDLVLKLYATTNEMIKTAQLAEMAIVYGNRYRSSMREIDAGLSNAEYLYYKGNYRDALDVSIQTIDLIEPGIYKKLLNVYGK